MHHVSDRKMKKVKKGNGNPCESCDSILHALVCVPGGMRVDGALCCSQPNLLCLCPNSIGIGPVPRGNGASVGASIAFLFAVG